MTWKAKAAKEKKQTKNYTSKILYFERHNHNFDSIWPFYALGNSISKSCIGEILYIKSWIYKELLFNDAIKHGKFI